jgi:hypothetical protein
MPHTLNNGTPKVDKFDALKSWLKLWQLYPAVGVVLLAGGWAANVQASQTSIIKEQESIKDEARTIRDDLKRRYEKDDERWQRLTEKLNGIYEMLSDNGRDG